ncbi:diaminopimelate decarboxylase [Litorilinea aerophila]|uniref:Diaminopimelate decarboxylase n=1 Tax=Litorilinea aerophila TaxID=1204385 RepID=A0A540VMR2_9CHLR|nr:diaminopimelate decarboxylase [Litorilinea aerophila]MCC9074741.1 diaminopimelate decarboxylase [Litorilinea aerophila]GIV75919.1 MAG: diaminopimelate decarboxylase [Litorilinea sp.]
MNHRRLELFPETTTVITPDDGLPTLAVAGCNLAELADRYGTPLYVLDQTTMDRAAAAYGAALKAHYPGPSGITFAGKALLCLAVAQWVQRQGLWLDCTGAGELHIAGAAGVARERLLVHGVNKSQEDLAMALARAGVVVVDNLTELTRIVTLARQATSPLPDLWLRVRPGVAVETHAYRQTGQEDSKFGMDGDEVMEAVALCQRHGLPLTGIHFHQGSQFRDPAPIGPALERVLDLVDLLRERQGWTPQVICPGGGWGVAYHEDELPHPAIVDYVAFIAQALVHGCQKRSLPLPRLHLEPGRSLVARAGVAVYRVGTVKRTAHRRWLLLDGGMADNPRPALYGARYSALPVQEPWRPPADLAWLAGPYCESGDVLIEGLPLPELAPGELVAVPVSGAYHLAMGSNYNGARRPAVVWVHQGQAHLIQRRESLEDLLRRDLPLP